MFLPIIATSIILGKSFDLNLLQPIKTIFELKDADIQQIDSTYTRSEYKLVESSADTTDFLDVDGELSLKIKKGSFDVSGSGKYLKQSVDRTKTVELLLSMTFESYTKTFPTYSKQVEGWHENRKGATHFIRSIVYGGQLIITYRLQSDSSEDMENIKAVVKANLETSGSVNANVQGKFEKIQSAVSKLSKVDIQAFYTGRLKEAIPTSLDLDGVFYLIDNYPKLLIEPMPLRFELESLSTLRPSDIPTLPKHDGINQILDDANDKYDDVRVALTLVKKLQDDVEDLDSDLKRKMRKIRDQARDAMDKLEDAINRLDLSKPFDPSLFDEAFKEYAKGGYNVPNRFTREISEVANLAVDVIPPWYPYTRAVNEYIRWGNITCSLPSPEPIFIGYAVGAPNGFGSGSDVLCVGPEPELVPRDTAVPPPKTAAISGLAYQDPAVPGVSSALVCARCQLENATSIITIPAKDHCPEGTKMEYDGFLATGSNVVTSPICIDRHPVDRHPDFKEWDTPDVNVFKPVWMKCSGDCIQPENYVRCVVCSR